MKTKVDIKHNKYKIYLTGTWVGCILLIGAGYFVFHLPKKGQLVQVQRQYTESQDQLTIANKATQDDIRQQAEQCFEDTANMINKYSVPQDNITGVVFEIGKIANELGLSEFSSKNQKAQNLSTLGDSKVVSEAWLEVEFESSFLKFAQFVNRLEQETPVVFIEKIVVRRNENSQKNSDVKMELSFLTTESKVNSVAVTNPQ